MGLALVMCLYDCCPVTPSYTRTHKHTTTPNNRLKDGQYLSFCFMNHLPHAVLVASVIKRNEAVRGGNA